MNRDKMLRAVGALTGPVDICVIGGGATGMGIALDAASRGYSVVLFEAHDFGKGTSSRSTKLVHGGVRYLKNGQIGLVMEALEERGILRRNAPDLVGDLAFIVPVFRAFDWAMYGTGLKLYDWLAGKYGYGKTEFLGRDETIQRLPGVRAEGLQGGILYHDGQADDARLLIRIAQHAVAHGAILVNYSPVVRISANRVTAHDLESDTDVTVEAKIVINAGGPFSDSIRRLADPGSKVTVATSQGAHIVVDGAFLPGSAGLMVPKTADGRVLFAIPWYGRTLIGTTDTPVQNPTAEPAPLPREIDFILDTARCCLQRPPRRNDVTSAFAGIRPLVLKEGARSTAALSRDHTIRREPSGILTIVGGKWTTYRHMAEDCVNQAAEAASLPARECRTRDLPLSPMPGEVPVDASDAAVRHAVREQMARTVEDVLARRSRLLFLDAKAAMAAAPTVAATIASEVGWTAERVDAEVRGFLKVAQGYSV